jgi:hypothetical protein
MLPLAHHAPLLEAQFHTADVAHEHEAHLHGGQGAFYLAAPLHHGPLAPETLAANRNFTIAGWLHAAAPLPAPLPALEEPLQGADGGSGASSGSVALAPPSARRLQTAPRELLLSASGAEIAHALAALGVERELAGHSGALAAENRLVRVVLCGVVKAALALNEAAWTFSTELHERGDGGGGSSGGGSVVVADVEREWCAAKAAALRLLEEELGSFDAVTARDGGSPLATHAHVLADWRAFEAFLDAKVHSREERRSAWERAERLKVAHARALLPPAGMLSALLAASMAVAPRHPETGDIMSQGGGPPAAAAGGGAAAFTSTAGLLGSLQVPRAAAGAASGAASGAAASADAVTGHALGDVLIHVDHCASAEVPQKLQVLLVDTIAALAAGCVHTEGVKRVSAAVAEAQKRRELQ